MKKLNHIIFLILLFFVVSCEDSSTESEIKELLNTFWKLESFETDGKIVVPPKDQIYNIQFYADYTLSGRSDCNEILGGFKLKSNYITIDSLMTTEMYCGDTSLGDKYFTALHESETYQIPQDVLTIYCENNLKLSFIGE